MNTTHTTSDLPVQAVPQERTLKATAGVSITEAVGGLGTIVLAILAIAGVLQRFLGPIAVIAVGGSLFVEGGAIGSRYMNRLRAIGGEHIRPDELGLGMTAEFLAGAAGVVLGILALAGIATISLISTAVLVFGAALLLGSATTSRMTVAAAAPGEADTALQHVLNELTVASSGSQVLLGLGAAVLGILALVGLNPFILSMVALLCCGCSILFTGTTVGSKMVNLLHG
ncbi:MAG: hypothetical protein ACREFX_08495 [Opitutaceae bacterium]